MKPFVSGASTSFSGGNLTASATQSFTAKSAQSQTIITLLPTWAGTMYVLLNSTGATATNWDYYIPAQGQLIVDNVRVASLSIYSTANATFGTDFQVRGWA